MIYLSPEHKSALGEDTFWTWFEREFEGSAFRVPESIEPDDVVLRYSTLGPPRFGEHTVALLWELHPEMKARLDSPAWDTIIRKINDCARGSRFRVVSSPVMRPYYEAFGAVEVLPIGVDTDLFRPMDKAALRRKYGIPADKRVGFWSGTTHPMKGFQNLLVWHSGHPEIRWITVWKQRSQHVHLEGAYNYVHVPQQQLAELMNCADFCLSCGLLRPFFMVEWEAMACNLPLVVIDGAQKEFIPPANPRDDVLGRKWDRRSARGLWARFLEKATREINGN